MTVEMNPSLNEKGIGNSPSLEPTPKGKDMSNGECELYVDPSFTEALKIWKKLFKEGAKHGYFHPCSRDALFELGQHVSALLGNLGMSTDSLPAIEPPRDGYHALALFGGKVYQLENASITSDEQKAVLGWLWQIIQWIISLIFNRAEGTAPGVTMGLPPNDPNDPNRPKVPGN